MPRKPAPLYVVVYRSTDRATWEREGWLASPAVPREAAQEQKEFLESQGRHCLGPRKHSEHQSIGFPETFDRDDPLPGGTYE
jgi:hypothetical protein